MNVAQLLDALLLGEDDEVLEASLPEVAAFERAAPQRKLLRMVSVAQARKQAPGESLLDSLHDDGGIAALGLGEQQVDVLGHDDVSDYSKTVAPPHLLQHVQEQVAIMGAAEQWQALVPAGGDEVRVSRPVIAMEPVGHGSGVA